MKFTNYLKDIQNVSVYPVISLVLFTAIFAFVVVYVFKKKKKSLNDKANIPLK